MDSLDGISPQRPEAGPPPRARRASRLARIAVPAIALALVGVAVITALVAGSVVISRVAVTPTASPTPTATPTATPAATPTASPTAIPTPTPVPTPTPIPIPTPTAGPPRPLPTWQLTGYVWPMANAVITQPYGPSQWGEFMVNGSLFHDGVDMAMATKGACGAKVMAAHDGVVLTAGRDYADFMGWHGDLTAYKKRFSAASWKASLPVVIVIDDGDGYRSIYAHEWANVKVKAGQHVKAGQLIGYEGMTGNATGCHLHFGLYSPLETATFANLPYAMKTYHLPATETARVNPLLVLPYRNDVEEMRTLRPLEAAAWASAHPSASPSS